jgi:mannosyl-3-phosphoglycerate phosphatase
MRAMLKQNSQMPLVFTDLDGSLLDHYTYSFSAARPLLDKLESMSVPVIPVTSKTFAEVTKLRETLCNQHPFVTENGAAIFIPRGYFGKKPAKFSIEGDFWVLRNSKPRHHWLTLLRANAKDFADEYESFTTIVDRDGIEGLAQLTGLSSLQATLSNQRQHSEPIRWMGSSVRKKLFVETLTKTGAKLLQGGRFLSMGGQTNKGEALLQLQSIFATNNIDSDICSLAIGDSNNDIDMLDAASSALIIKSTHHKPPMLSRHDNLLLSDKPGPKGWVEGVSKWLNTFSF